MWFAGTWLGYSLFAGRLYLSTGLTISRCGEANGKAHVVLSSFGFAASLLVLVALLEWTLEPTLVETAARLAQSHGALVAIFSVLSGGASLALLSWLAARRIREGGLSV